MEIPGKMSSDVWKTYFDLVNDGEGESEEMTVTWTTAGCSAVLPLESFAWMMTSIFPRGNRRIAYTSPVLGSTLNGEDGSEMK